MTELKITHLNPNRIACYKYMCIVCSSHEPEGGGRCEGPLARAMQPAPQGGSPKRHATPASGHGMIPLFYHTSLAFLLALTLIAIVPLLSVVAWYFIAYANFRWGRFMIYQSRSKYFWNRSNSLYQFQTNTKKIFALI